MEERNGAVQTMGQNSTSENSVSYFVLEGVMTHFSIIIKRLLILFALVSLMFTLVIAGLIYYISLPVEESERVTVENDDGNASYIGNDMNGDFNYGESN